MITREQAVKAAADLEAKIRRQVDQRRELCAVAVSAAVPQAAGIAAALNAGGRPWWPALAPLTKPERAAVYRAVVEGTTAARSANNVD